jgi:hypothetical protein
MTLTEIMEVLKREDEVSLLEILDISSEEIVDRFEDRIEERADYLEQYLKEDGEEE